MARYNMNRYQYETSPRKLQPEYEPIKKKYPKKSTATKTEKSSSKKQLKNNVIYRDSFCNVICYKL